METTIFAKPVFPGSKYQASLCNEGLGNRNNMSGNGYHPVIKFWRQKEIQHHKNGIPRSSVPGTGKQVAKLLVSVPVVNESLQSWPWLMKPAIQE